MGGGSAFDFHTAGTAVNVTTSAWVKDLLGGYRDRADQWSLWKLGRRAPAPKRLSPKALGLLRRLRDNTGAWKTVKAAEVVALHELRAYGITLEYKDRPMHVANAATLTALAVRMP